MHFQVSHVPIHLFPSWVKLRSSSLRKSSFKRAQFSCVWLYTKTNTLIYSQFMRERISSCDIVWAGQLNFEEFNSVLNILINCSLNCINLTANSHMENSLKKHKENDDGPPAHPSPRKDIGVGSKDLGTGTYDCFTQALLVVN